MSITKENVVDALFAVGKLAPPIIDFIKALREGSPEAQQAVDDYLGKIESEEAQRIIRSGK